MFTETDVRTLTEFESDGFPLTSLYFYLPKVANRSHREEFITLKALFREARQKAGRQALSPERTESIENDTRRMLEFLSQSLENGGGRALALFACSGREFFRSLRLPGGVETDVQIGDTFAVRPLVSLLDEYPRHAVAVLDRERGYLYEFALGEIEDQSSIRDEAPPRVRATDWGGYRERRIERHIDEEARRHYQRIAEGLGELLKRRPFDRLLIAGHREAFSEFESALPEELRRRVTGRFAVDPRTASAVEIRQRALEVLREAGLREKQGLIADLLNEAGPDGLGVVGLEPTLGALSRREAQTLFVGEGYRVGGKRCARCGYLGGVWPSPCPQCSAPLQAVEDIVEHAIRAAIQESAQVRFIQKDARFERAGNIGALLRYRTQQRAG